MKGRVLGILVLIIWGLAKIPFEATLSAEQKKLRYGDFQINTSLRQQAGQAGLIAVLGGLRSAVADLLWIRAHMAWQDVKWPKMKVLFDVTTNLQPRRTMFWDTAAWHMAWNASVHAENDIRNVPDEFDRLKNKFEFYRLGEEYLLAGIRNNPDSWELWDRLGLLYRDKFKEPCRASAAYEEASKRPGRLDYTRRLAVYYLMDCPGRERDAYDRMLALYKEGEHEWLPTLLKRLQLLERKLNIPKDARVYIPEENRLPPE